MSRLASTDGLTTMADPAEDPTQTQDIKLIDPHVHMSARTTDDYERMAASGVVALIEPAFWLGQPRTNIGSFTDYLSSLVGFERFRPRSLAFIITAPLVSIPKKPTTKPLPRR